MRDHIKTKIIANNEIVPLIPVLGKVVALIDVIRIEKAGNIEEIPVTVIEKDMDFIWVDQPVVESKIKAYFNRREEEGSQHISLWDKYPLLRISAFLTVMKCYRLLSNTSVNRSLYIKYLSDKIGYGLFTGQTIKKYSPITEYTGILRPNYKNNSSEYIAHRFSMSSFMTGGNPLQEMFIIDAKKAGNYSRFINHSYHPNTALVSIYYKNIWRLLIIAKENIQANDQLFFNYSKAYWRKREMPLELRN